VLLSPVALENFAGRGCGYETPEWVAEELARGHASTRRRQEALRIAEYLSADTGSYVHLIDGAFADNLGLRSTIEKSIEAGGYAQLAKTSGFTRFRRVAYLVVNAQTDSIRTWTRSANVPGMVDALNSATTVAVNRYNYETIELFRQDVMRLVTEIRAARCEARGSAPALPDCDDVTAHLIEISFAQHPDPAERRYLNELPTTLGLSAEQIDRTIAAARTILLESPQFQALLADLPPVLEERP
jgi:NTE family protein